MKWYGWIMLFTSLVFIFGAFFNVFVSVPNAAFANEINGETPTDWSVKMCDSIISRFLPETFGPWDYNEGLVLEGMWRVYERTGNTEYYDFIKGWVDRFVDDEGFISDDILPDDEELTGDEELTNVVVLDKLDNFMPGVLLCHLYEETRESKYKKAAQQIRDRIDTYTRTSDGGLVISISESNRVLLLDGTFMLSIFLINYGEVFGDAEYANDECADQLIIHNNHLKDTVTGLAWQGWDELGTSNWADPDTYLSPEIWCRAVGWYVVACVEVLEKLPTDHPDRQTIIGILVGYLDGIKNYQDSITGLWYQVVDKGDLLDNWVEESSACLYTYAISKAIDAGYVDKAEYHTTAKKGFEGALSNIELNIIGKTKIYGTCTGTGAGSPYSYYIDRIQPVNDKHGQGAFLFAFEQQRMKYSDLRQLYQAENGWMYNAMSRTNNKGWTGASYVDFSDQIVSILQMRVDATITGDTTLAIRYANGDTADRPMEISVNSEVISNRLSFVSTNAWTAWRQQTISIPLVLGKNIIQLKSITPTGGPNIDWVAFETPIYFNETPQVTNIHDHKIDVGGNFATINLDDFVSDVDDTDAEMTWTYSGNTSLTVSIDSSRIATIGIPGDDWNGTETITFRATDPGALYDEDSVTFTVNTRSHSTVSWLEISPDEVGIGENVYVSFRVDNSGQTECIYQVLCRIDGVVVDEKQIKLARGTGNWFVFTLVFEEVGNKIIDVNLLTGSLIVKEPEEELRVVSEIPDTKGSYEFPSVFRCWWIVLVILVICALLIYIPVYLIKQKKI